VIGIVKRLERFQTSYALNDNGCWEWQRGRRPNGYGVLMINRSPQYAHRVSFMLHVGPIPDGLCVLHRCDNRCCVNPDHLFLGTKGDNNRDRAAKGRSAPRHGEFSASRKLTWEDVRFIRANYRRGSHTWGQTALGRRFGVCHETIRKIINGDHWINDPALSVAVGPPTDTPRPGSAATKSVVTRLAPCPVCSMPIAEHTNDAARVCMVRMGLAGERTPRLPTGGKADV
jgi:hypothetical protein